MNPERVPVKDTTEGWRSVKCAEILPAEESQLSDFIIGVVRRLRVAENA